MMTDDVERGAAEDNSGVPVTPTEIEASKTPPSVGGGHSGETPEDQDDGVRAQGGAGAAASNPSD
jgi:hypothetical protein